MPYRRLPNTDRARIQALSIAIDKSKELTPDQLAFSYKTLQRAKFFLPTYTQSLYHKSIESSHKHEKETTYSFSKKKVKLYISHFIQVLNFCILRGELSAKVRAYYNLEKYIKKVPPLTTDEDILYWGKTIIEGEEERVMNGGTPIFNPRIALVNIQYQKFLEAQRNHVMFTTKNNRAVKYINELRAEAHEIIQKIWNEVEYSFRTLSSPQERRKSAEEYGVKYVFRPGELKS
ncbi:MAG: hypothetical protein R6U95_09285 [Bacteroidales bacterium]